jgi:hypothetical protein
MKVLLLIRRRQTLTIHADGFSGYTRQRIILPAIKMKILRFDQDGTIVQR